MSYFKILTLLLLILSYPSFSKSQSDTLTTMISTHINNGEFRSIIIGSYNKYNGEKLYSFGEISRNNQNTPTGENIFEIGSLSKVFTGLILSSLHLNGTLSINDKVSSILKSLKKKPAGEIKLIELATHMSGLPRLPSNLKNIDMADQYGKYSEEMLMNYLNSLKEIKKPSEFSGSNYSNVGFGLLGYILQKKTNLSYNELVKKYITSPLGMNNTFANVPKNKMHLLVPGHNELLEVTSPWSFQSSMDGAGVLKSTASDLMVFLRANMTPESTNIEKALKFSQKPRFINTEKGIGIAWGLKFKNGKVEGIGHNGGTGGFSSNLQISLKEKKGFLYLVNTSNSPQCMASVLITSTECKPKFSRRVRKSILDSYIGTYLNKKTGLKFVLSQHFGQLVYEIPDQEMGKTLSISDTEFSIKGIAFIRFSSKLGEFEFEQNGSKLTFELL
ncbi:serine hydrolase [bacterium]|nr:serine hydrolase [bacterium]